MPKSKKRFDADKWLKRHMEKLVDKFAGKYIVVADGEIFHGASPSQLRKKAKAKHPKTELLGIRVPHPQDFLCALILL